MVDAGVIPFERVDTDVVGRGAFHPDFTCPVSTAWKEWLSGSSIIVANMPPNPATGVIAALDAMQVALDQLRASLLNPEASVLQAPTL